MFFVIGTLIANAQNNTLTIPSVTAGAGKTISLPVNMDNTSDVVAVQFTLTVPDGLSVDPAKVSLTERAVGLTVTMCETAAGKYMAMVYSPTNLSIKGRTGTLLTVPLTVASSMSEESSFPLTLSDVVIGIADGHNVTTGIESGNLTVGKSPDLEVADVSVSTAKMNPSDSFSVAWHVSNIGGMPTAGGWTEQVILTGPDGASKVLSTLYYDEPLNVGAEVSRNTEITLPELLGVDGEGFISVKVTPASNAGEPSWLRDNNTAQAPNGVEIGKILTLTPANVKVEETSKKSVKLFLTRSGSVSSDETFQIDKVGDERISVPSSVIIPKGQSGVYIYLNLLANGRLDDSSLMEIGISGNGYEQVKSELTIEDDTLPALSMELDKYEVIEGEDITFTLTAQRAPQQDLTIMMGCENPGRFAIPSVILPAGQNQVRFMVEAKDDNVPDITRSVMFTAFAEGYGKATEIVDLVDNDVPNLQLTFTPDAVSEAAGPLSIAAVLQRTDKEDTAITVRFSDDSNGSIFYGRETVEIPAGVKEVTVNLGPIDNAVVDGERTYNVTAAVWIASCSCNASEGSSGGEVTVPLTVYDNDGPALTLKSSVSVLKEGGEMNVIVSRNTTDVSSPLNVNVSCDHDGQIEYPAIITIPEGTSFTSFTVRSVASDGDNDDFTTVLTVGAEGFAKANVWFMVTDQSLPDAQISNIDLSDSKVEAGYDVDVRLTLVNIGALDLPEMTKVSIYQSRDSKPLAYAYLQSPLAPGEETVVAKTINLPDAIGKYNLYAVANEDHEVKELMYSNNTSPYAAVEVVSPFEFTMNVDRPIYRQGETVKISGVAKGSDVFERNIDVYVVNEGYRQVLEAVTDEHGAFSVDYVPYKGLIGHFDVGACYPKEGSSNGLAEFDIYGIRRSGSGSIYCEALLGEDYNSSFRIVNPGNLAVSGLSVNLVSKPDNCLVELLCPTTLNGKESGDIAFKITPLSASEGSDWEKIVIEITSEEGEPVSVPLSYYCNTPAGKLQASISSINTTMTKGATRDYPFEIINTGKGETGKISLALPNWMTAATPLEMASLKSGESTTVVLRLTPDDNMQLNVPVTGMIGINCQNAQGIAMPFRIEPVSEIKGTLTIDVCDEYSYYTAEAPHVKGAEVRISHPTTGMLMATGLTDENGKFSVEINEGYYALSVSADQHDTYTNNVLVDPGTEKNMTVNLSVQAIEISYDVEETTVEDEYKIVTTLKFAVNVPIPAVELIVPSSIDAKSLAEGESLIFNAVLTNKGLVTARDVQFITPEGFRYLTFEPLVNADSFDLAPQQSVQIPVKVTHVAEDDRMRIRPIDDDPCVAQPGTLYFWDCGLDRKWHRYSIAMQVGSCRSNDPSTWDNSGNGGYGGGGGGGGGIRPVPHTGFGGYESSSSNNSVSTKEDTGCEPCQNQFMLDLVDCGLQLVPAYKTLKAVVNCVSSVNNALKLSQKEPTYGQMYGAILDAVSSCMAAKNAGSGDKNQSRAKKREEAVEAIILALGQISGKLLQQEAGWDDTVDLLGTLAQSLSTMAGFDYDNLEEMFCPLKLFKPCDKEGNATPDQAGSRNLTKVLNQNAYPSYIQEFQQTLAYPFIDQMALMGIKYEFFGDINWLNADESQLSAFFDVFYSLQGEDDSISSDAYPTLIGVKPENISKESIYKFIERWNNSLRGENSENSINYEEVSKYFDLFEIVDSAVASKGYDSFAEYFEIEYYKCREEAEKQSNSVCSSITLQFDQKMVLTRQAFRGTLKVFNGNESAAMTDVKLSVTVKDEEGNLATSHEFQINPESLSGFEGDLSLMDGWTLDSQENGKATIMFIPTKYAAPTVGKVYHFGGSLSYIDPFTGLEVTRTLSPIALTVNPSPDLDLTYFMQRDVYGDDPLTEAIEPSEEAEFSLLINNQGYGDAANVRMVTDQPKIVENDKGLLIDFELVSSQLNGEDKTMALGNSVATDFGDIPAKSTAYAQWWIKSSLLGHFTDYKVEATHVSSYGNPDLSLLNEVTIHELIRSIDINDGETVLKGFMTNDVVDADDAPDMMYLSNGEIEPVSILTRSGIIKGSDNDYELTVHPNSTGWNYGSLSDPTYGLVKLAKVVRKSDSKEISLRNFWQTDRTLRDGKDPLYENRIHLVDNFSFEGEETYILTFEPMPDLQLEIVSIEGVPSEGEIALTPVENVKVMFNKQIDPDTFTSEDISLSVQGEAMEATQIAISTNDSKTFILDLTEVNKKAVNGYYVLTIQTAGVTDTEGFSGKTGKTVGWNMYADGMVLINVSVNPADAGTVAGERNVKYGEEVSMMAEANEGYLFSHWTVDDKDSSTDVEFNRIAINNMKVVANFKAKTFNVNVAEKVIGGHIDGFASGIYEYGQTLSYNAVPDDQYEFESWIVNGQPYSSETSIEITVKEDTEISAVFQYTGEYHVNLNMAAGWNWISHIFVPALDVRSFMEEKTIGRILSQTQESIRDPQTGVEGNLTELVPQQSYKAMTTAPSASTLSGKSIWKLSDPISVSAGWNWIGYPVTHTMTVEEAFAKTDVESLDVIVGQSGFSQYDGEKWIGTLETMSPGFGYMYFSKSRKNIVYNSESALNSLPRFIASAIGNSPYVLDIHKYYAVMPVIATLCNIDGTSLDNNDYQVAAFCGSECRGIGRVVEGLVMMNVYGNPNDDITFLVTDSYSGAELNNDASLKFREVVVGDLFNPYIISTGASTGVDEVAGSSHVKVFFEGDMLLIKGVNVDDIRYVEVYDIQGQKLIHETHVPESGIRVNTLSDGIYLVIVNAQGEYSYHKVSK